MFVMCVFSQGFLASFYKIKKKKSERQKTECDRSENTKNLQRFEMGRRSCLPASIPLLPIFYQNIGSPFEHKLYLFPVAPFQISFPLPPTFHICPSTLLDSLHFFPPCLIFLPLILTSLPLIIRNMQRGRINKHDRSTDTQRHIQGICSVLLLFSSANTEQRRKWEGGEGR